VRRFVNLAAACAAGLAVMIPAMPAAQQTSTSSPTTAAADEFADEARVLAGLRAEIESLDASLRQKRDRAAERLRSLDVQADELELLLERERLALADIERAQSRERDRQSADEQLVSAASDVLRESIGTLESRIRGAIPFRQRDRLDFLDGLRRELDDGSIDIAAAYAQVWRFIEDELQLARTWGPARVPLRIDGAMNLVETFRLGMVALYTRTEDGVIGSARPRADGGYDLVPLTGDVADEVRRLMDDAAARPPSDVYVLPVDGADGAGAR
jgi:hypothetical protein